MYYLCKVVKIVDLFGGIDIFFLGYIFVDLILFFFWLCDFGGKFVVDSVVCILILILVWVDEFIFMFVWNF